MQVVAHFTRIAFTPTTLNSGKSDRRALPRFAELAGGGARSVRGADVHRQSDHEDNAAGPAAVEVRAGGRVAGGRVVRQHQVLQAVRPQLAQAQQQEQR